ncbi:pectin lyase-like protein [Thelephora terrestris]|uniref:galacturonan 1,4-alpha-galacturonidase n=1 Tax=Thelephora terrestris TaxID=56493 RepID=A0A9P6HC09_9AGAM|nr:pectin lyase-like protein [Thelephora terrestris]
MHLLRLIFALFSASFAAAWTTYIVPHSGGNDDTPALAAALSANKSLTTNATILFKKGVTYNLLTPIKFPTFHNVIVSIQGNITYASDIATTQSIVASSSFPGHWFSFSGGTNIKVQGSQDPNWGWINANGQKWWDAMQQVSLQVNRPPGWGFNGISTGEIVNLKLWQPIAWSFSFSGCNNVYIHNNTILAISYSSSFPYNTDAFDVGGTNLIFENNNVYNGDDCLMITGPASNIIFRNSYCNGGHGLSVGTLSATSNVVVQNILIDNVVMENSVYGARYKSFTGGVGSAKNITWSNITLKKVRLPIYITQHYWDQDNGPKPTNSSSQTSTSLDTFTFQNFQGTIDDSKGNGVSGSTGKEVVIFDLYQGTSKSLLAKDISTTTVSGSNVMVMCDSSTVSNDVGFKCWDGQYEPTAAGK